MTEWKNDWVFLWVLWTCLLKTSENPLWAFWTCVRVGYCNQKLLYFCLCCLSNHTCIQLYTEAGIYTFTHSTHNAGIIHTPLQTVVFVSQGVEYSRKANRSQWEHCYARPLMNVIHIKDLIYIKNGCTNWVTERILYPSSLRFSVAEKITEIWGFNSTYKSYTVYFM